MVGLRLVTCRVWDDLGGYVMSRSVQHGARDPMRFDGSSGSSSIRYISGIAGTSGTSGTSGSQAVTSRLSTPGLSFRQEFALSPIPAGTWTSRRLLTARCAGSEAGECTLGFFPKTLAHARRGSGDQAETRSARISRAMAASMDIRRAEIGRYWRLSGGRVRGEPQSASAYSTADQSSPL